MQTYDLAHLLKTIGEVKRELGSDPIPDDAELGHLLTKHGLPLRPVEVGSILRNQATPSCAKDLQTVLTAWRRKHSIQDDPVTPDRPQTFEQFLERINEIRTDYRNTTASLCRRVAQEVVEEGAFTAHLTAAIGRGKLPNTAPIQECVWWGVDTERSAGDSVIEGLAYFISAWKTIRPHHLTLVEFLNKVISVKNQYDHLGVDKFKGVLAEILAEICKIRELPLTAEVLGYLVYLQINQHFGPDSYLIVQSLQEAAYASVVPSDLM